jgi:hypothetical protein
MNKKTRSSAICGVFLNLIYSILITSSLSIPVIADDCTALVTKCPDPNVLTQKQDSNHWYSPIANNTIDKAKEQCNSCEDPNNQTSSSCAVYSFLKSDKCKNKSSCADPQGEFNIYRKSNLQYALEHDLRYKTDPRFASDTCHVVVFALNPTIGIEDRNARTNYPYWNHAYVASQRLIRPAINPQLLGLAINPATKRSQHQLHIHIGTLKKGVRNKINTLKQDPSIVQSIEINNIQYKARYVLNASTKGQFTGEDPFSVAEKIIGEESPMPEHGILAVLSSSTNGIFVLTAENKFLEGELDYGKGANACKLAAAP